MARGRGNSCSTFVYQVRKFGTHSEGQKYLNRKKTGTFFYVVWIGSLCGELLMLCVEWDCSLSYAVLFTVLMGLASTVVSVAMWNNLISKKFSYSLLSAHRIN